MTYLNQCWKKGNVASPLFIARPKQQPEDEGANSHRKLQLLPESKTRNRGAPLRLEACWREGLQRHSKAAPPPAPPGHGNGPRPLVTVAAVDQTQGGGRMDVDRCREGRSTSCNRRKEVTGGQKWCYRGGHHCLKSRTWEKGASHSEEKEVAQVTLARVWHKWWGNEKHRDDDDLFPKRMWADGDCRREREEVKVMGGDGRPRRERRWWNSSERGNRTRRIVWFQEEMRKNWTKILVQKLATPSPNITKVLLKKKLKINLEN